MGIVNLLPNLSKLSQKICLSDSYKLEISEPPPCKRQRQTSKNYYHGRKIRVAIDISTWIASACHGNGAELLDERHLSTYGRAELLHKRNNESKRGNNDNDDNLSDRESTSNCGTMHVDAMQVDQVQLFISRASNSVLRKISSLQKCLSTEILIVFDGDTPPVKQKCCEQRKKNRNEAASNRDHVIGCSPTSHPNIVENNAESDTIKNGLNKIAAAKKAGAHTSEMYTAVVTSLLKTLREHNIPFLISPYEADGQLAYLSKNGFIDLIISEDGDFIGHGAKAVLYKYKEVYVQDKYDHDDKLPSNKAIGVLIRRKDIHAKNEAFDLSDFNDVMLASLCVAAGCDYCDSLMGIGIKKARNAVHYAFVGTKKKTPKLKLLFDYLFRSAYGSGNISAEEKNEYINNFLAALVMFRHPVVFDPNNVCLIFSNYEYPDSQLMEYEPYAAIIQNRSKMEQIVGKLYCKEMALYVVEGYINPKTWSLLSSENEVPNNVCDALQKWNTMTYHIERESTNNENEIKDNIIASQCSGTSSASKFSSQTSNRSSKSALSPNLLV